MMVHDKTTKRVRGLHDSCRPRAFRPAFRDTEARRGTPRGRCEESPSARPETKASLSSCFPRFKRPTLKRFRRRRCRLSSNFRIGQALSHNLRYREVEAVTVIHRTGLSGTIVEAPRLLIQISEQVERLDAHIGSTNAALEKAPEVLKSVSVNAPVNVTLGVVNDLVCESRPQVLIRHERIGIDRATFLDVAFNFAVESVLAPTRNNGSADFAAAFEDAYDWSLST